VDPLDHLAGPAADLIARVDRVLGAAGAPEGHRIWSALRALRVLPGEALAVVTALDPTPLRAAGTALRRLVPRYAEAHRRLTVGSGASEEAWRGAAAESFSVGRDALAAYLLDGPDSAADRLDRTAGYAEAIADWVTTTRHDLARTLAEVLGSAEAVLIRTADDGVPTQATVLAAAEIAARVLSVVAEAYDRAEELRRQWAGRLDEASHPAPTVAPSGWDAALRVSY
jgi:hypothetical protein